MYRVFEHSCFKWFSMHLDYASKPKNSTEAIYEGNPQLLSCQPNIYMFKRIFQEEERIL